MALLPMVTLTSPGQEALRLRKAHRCSRITDYARVIAFGSDIARGDGFRYRPLQKSSIGCT